MAAQSLPQPVEANCERGVSRSDWTSGLRRSPWDAPYRTTERQSPMMRQMSWIASLRPQASAICGWPMPGRAMLDVAAIRHWRC
eukprot:14421239-Heterocapsa_arctica.AAC.1